MSDRQSSPNDHGPERDTDVADTERDHDKVQKRKASSPPPSEEKPNQSPKRTRLDTDDAKEDQLATALPTPKDSGPDRRENALQEERKRGKRLFGGLLSTLSQTTSSSQQKRRQEIERRQQAKVHQQKAEDEKHREEKLAKLRAVRRVEQLKFDEQVMQTRHSNMLAMARFLETRSTPKIYYLPWDPTEEQDEIIKNQIRDVQDLIDKEVLDFKRRKEQRLKALGVAVKPPTPEPEPVPEPKETVGKADDENSTTDLTKSDSTNRPPSHTRQAGHEKESDRADDVMIEEDEDTVIY
ncbi:pinin/SDK/memA/ protein conserved region-domain-containing protein [Whalleya microplaca]|nr:pinin/SDK/memA/ protein conserved region-domain-containing protein [Whalleya microplaca]